ncbi:MAG: hypothetical protein K9M94_07880 [Spirochaetia bacterium]|nr:hypothetical protein [Spirochaetia bacterium]
MLYTGSIQPAAADEQLNRQSYRIISGEVYHVLAGVRWYDGEGGSLLFNRLDGKHQAKSWFADFLSEEDVAGYVWPENCNISLRNNKPGSGENVMEEGWLRKHDARLPYREGYPVSGYDIEVRDTLKSGSVNDAAQLVMDLQYLFQAPMMRDDTMSWSLSNDYNPEKRTLSFSVELVTASSVASEWDFRYGRNPATGEISHLTIRFFQANLDGYNDTSELSNDSIILADALTKNFNAFFLYRLYNYLHIYHTEKWPGYTLKYPDGILRRTSGESGRGYGYTIELISTTGG